MDKIKKLSLESYVGGIAFDKEGTVYFTVNENLFKIDKNFEKAQIVWSNPKGYYLQGIAFCAKKNVIYICAWHENRILSYSLENEKLSVFAGTGEEDIKDGSLLDSQFVHPKCVITDEQGDLYISNQHCIRKINITTSSVETIAGEYHHGYKDGEAKEARFHGPYGIALDWTGAIYVADYYNMCIRKICNGTVSTFAGCIHDSSRDLDGPLASAKFLRPWALYLDITGDLLVGGEYNCRRINLNSRTVSTEFTDTFCCCITADLQHFYIGKFGVGTPFEFWKVGRPVKQLNAIVHQHTQLQLQLYQMQTQLEQCKYSLEDINQKYNQVLAENQQLRIQNFPSNPSTANSAEPRIYDSIKLCSEIPKSICCDSNGTIYFITENFIYQLLDNQQPGKIPIRVKARSLSGITVDYEGYICICDRLNNESYLRLKMGKQSQEFFELALSHPTRLVATNQGMYVADDTGICFIPNNGEPSTTKIQVGSGKLYYAPTDFVVQDQVIYCVDLFSDQLFRIEGGIADPVVGVPGCESTRAGPFSSATLRSPLALTATADGVIYVVCEDSVCKVDIESKNVSIVWKHDGHQITCLCLDNQGNIVVGTTDGIFRLQVLP